MARTGSAATICRYVPAHPDLSPPATLCTTAFACTEQDGLIWASVADEPPELALDLADAEPLRSLVIEEALTNVGPMLAEARFPITEAWKPGEGIFATIEASSALVIREGRAGDIRRRLITALQPLPGGRTAAHALTSPSASPKLKTALSRWLERSRWFVENPGAETRSWRPTDAMAEA